MGRAGHDSREVHNRSHRDGAIIIGASISALELWISLLPSIHYMDCANHESASFRSRNTSMFSCGRPNAA